MINKRKKNILTLLLLLVSLVTFSQNSKDNNEHNIIDNKVIIIKDSITAVSIVEPILFSIYGKDNIVLQRPYSTEFKGGKWIIKGNLKEGELGGTFIIIIDATNSKIIRLSHSK